VLFLVEMDKGVIEVEALTSGTLAEIFGTPGQEIAVGVPCCARWPRRVCSMNAVCCIRSSTTTLWDGKTCCGVYAARS